MSGEAWGEAGFGARPRSRWRWGGAVIGLAAFAAGAVHLLLAGPHFDESWALGIGFVVSGSALAATGLALATGGLTRLRGLAAATTAGLTAAAYGASRSVGLPGVGREAWDRVGVATTLVELAVVAAVAFELRPRLTRRTAAPLLAGLILIPAVARANVPPTNAPTRCVIPTKTLTLYAEELPNGSDGRRRLGFGTRPDNASTPGPLIEMTEGDCLAVTLVNHISPAALAAVRDDGRWPSDPTLPLGVSLHPHGVRYTPASDGTLHTGSFVPPGQARTYLWYAAPRIVSGGRILSPGSAGYWWYHDHVAGTDHGTGGLASGLFGGLIVRRPHDPKPDRTFVVAMGGPGALINFRSWPATFACDQNGNQPGPDCFVATQGQHVEFLVIGVPGPLAREDLHVFHLHGHTWADNRTGLLSTPDDDTRVIDAKSVAPSETFGFQVLAGDDVGPGDWMLHCHIQEHTDRGMFTFFRVLPSATGLPVSASANHHAGHGGAP